MYVLAQPSRASSWFSASSSVRWWCGVGTLEVVDFPPLPMHRRPEKGKVDTSSPLGLFLIPQNLTLQRYKTSVFWSILRKNILSKIGNHMRAIN